MVSRHWKRQVARQAEKRRQADQQGREALFRDKVLEKRQQLGSQAAAYVEKMIFYEPTL